MEIYFPQEIFEKSSNTKIHENPSSGSRFAPYGQADGPTDLTKLTVAFRNFSWDTEERVDDNMDWVELAYKVGRAFEQAGMNFKVS